MKNIKILIFYILVFQTSHAQTNLVPNPSFEQRDGCPPIQGNGYDPDGFAILDYIEVGPTDIPNLLYWLEPARGGWLCGVGTTDYWHACAGTNSNFVHPGGARTGDGYIGLHANGTTSGDYREYITTELISPLIKNHRYYVEFYTVPLAYNLKSIGVCFSNGRPEQCYTTVPQGLYQPWNYVGNDVNRVITPAMNWTKVSGYYTAADNYSWITLGDIADDGNNYGEGYAYIDDVAVYDLGACNCAGECTCIDIRLIENAWYSITEPPIEASNYIRAGYDVGNPGLNGDVIVKSGSNIAYRAGNYVNIEMGFIVENGAVFTASTHSCDASVAANSFSILNQPNVFTPNGDGVNDQLCYQVVGVTNYFIRVWDRWGIQKYEGSGSIPYSTSTSTLCVWNGSFNMNGSGPPCNDVYTVIITFSNCASSTTFGNDYDVTILGTSPCRLDLSSNDEMSINVYPNPTTTGAFHVEVNGYMGEKEILLYDMVGKEALKVISLPEAEANTDIDLSLFPKGIYFVKVKTGDVVTVKTIIYI